MLGSGHITSGVIVAPFLSYAVANTWVDAALCSVAVIAGVIIPDVDKRNSKFSRLLGPVTGVISWLVCMVTSPRKQTHSVLVALALAGLVMALSGSYPTAIGLFVGLLLHSVGDLPNTKPVHVAWPIAKRGVCLRWWTAGGTGDVVTCSLILVACVAFTFGDALLTYM